MRLRQLAHSANCYYNKMPTWDERKRLSNLELHGLDFAEADAIWDGFEITLEDVREDYGERRWVKFSRLGLDVVVLVYTERDDDIRYISLRKATKHETKIFTETAKRNLH